MTRPAALAAIVAAALAAGWVGPLEAQCAMCRSLLATPEGQQLVSGFRRGILLLLAAPFAIFATVAFLAVRSQRRRRQGGQC